MYDYFMKKMIYQKFILGTENLEKALQNGLGGVIFFTKDIQTEKQFKKIIDDIKLLASIPPFLSIDQEGGRVERTENIRTKRLSARIAYKNGVEFLTKQTNEISEELKKYGINLNFAPCVDVNTNIKNPIIGERSYSDKYTEVITGAEIFIKSLRKQNIRPCIKHFPGHGDADSDSHLTLPRIDLSFDEMKNVHIKPFEYFIKDNIEMIMVAHLHCTCFDSKTIPTSLSQNAINYLRNELGYNGVLISDDMVMKGVEAYGKLESVIMGIMAGIDMFIFRNSDDETLEMIEQLCEIVNNNQELQKKVLDSYDRILKLKKRFNIV